MNETHEDDTNVIPFSFSRRSTDVPNDVAHPESKWFDDPLEDLLNEFPDAVDSVEDKRDFISHLENPLEKQLSFDQDLGAMSDSVLAKVDHLKESVQRLRYYLNELNLED